MGLKTNMSHVSNTNTSSAAEKVAYLKDSYIPSKLTQKLDDDTSTISDASTQSLSTFGVLEESGGETNFKTQFEVVEEERKKEVDSNEDEVAEDLNENIDGKSSFGNPREIIEKEVFAKKFELYKNKDLERKELHQNIADQRSTEKEVSKGESVGTNYSISLSKKKERSFEDWKEKCVEKESEYRKLRIELSILRAFKSIASEHEPYEKDGNAANELRKVFLENEKLHQEVEMLRSSRRVGSDTASSENGLTVIDGISCLEESNNELRPPSSIGDCIAHTSRNLNKKSKKIYQDDRKRGLMSCSILSVLNQIFPKDIKNGL